MDVEAVVFFSVLITVQTIVLVAYGRVIKRWRELLPAPLPTDWQPFDGDRRIGRQASVDLGGGWVPVGLDPGAVWSLTVVAQAGSEDAELIVHRRVRFPPPAGPTYRATTNPLAQLAESYHGLRVVPCGRSFDWVRANGQRLRSTRGQPDDVQQVLDELGVPAFDLLVAVPVG